MIGLMRAIGAGIGSAWGLKGKDMLGWSSAPHCNDSFVKLKKQSVSIPTIFNIGHRS